MINADRSRVEGRPISGFTNLKAIKGVFDQVALRINVDEANIDEVGSLYADLKQNDLLGHITPYLGKVTPLTEACADIEPICFDTASFARAEAPRTIFAHKGSGAHTLSTFLRNVLRRCPAERVCH